MHPYELKNPVGVYFGTILKKWRNERFEDARNTAAKLQLTNSFYRMIEAGLAKLHPQKSILLCQTFPEKSIDLYGLSAAMTLTYLTTEAKTKEQFIQITSPIIALDKSFDQTIQTIITNYDTLAKLNGQRKSKFILRNGLEKPLESIILNNKKRG